MHLDGSQENAFLFILIAYSLSIFTLAYIQLKRRAAKKKAYSLLEKHFEEISIQKKQIEFQTDIINRKNKELEQAQSTIKLQNKKLKEANEQLEEMIISRTQELMKTYQKLSFHIENAPLAVIELNSDLHITRWSTHSEYLFGYKSEQVLGNSIKDLKLVYHDNINLADEVLQRIRDGIKTKSFFKTKILNKRGSVLEIEWNNSVLLDSKSKIESILCIGNDVTEREKASSTLESLNKELNDFLYKASHDLRGPIARMRGLINIGLMESLDPMAHNYFGMLDNVAHELNIILSKLLTIYDINHHQFKVDEINIKEEIEIIIQKTQEAKIGLNLNFEVNLEQELTWHTDKLLFEVIIENFINHAVAYSQGQNSYLNFEVFSEKGILNMIVRDNGVGIEETVTNKIFDIFFQGSDNAKVNSGLNLYMVKKAVEKLEGSVNLLNPAKETVFEVKLPCLGKIAQ
jgi:PAS domain S-box-containing protein